MKLRLIAGAAMLGLALSGCSTMESAANKVTQTATAATATAPAAVNLHAAMQDLWHQHIVATRDYALAVYAGDQAAAQAAQDAEVANGHDIANAVAGVYGQDAGEGIFKLLAGHVGGVNALTMAAKNGDAAGEEQAMSDLSANAMQIAQFLAGANPENWTVDGINGALLAHAGHHRQQIDLLMSDAPQAEQDQAWSQMQEHMDVIAGVLADGIAKQFPDKVS